jgi:Concanavalin A-like lectin/glucanases superfamily/FecR protein
MNDLELLINRYVDGQATIEEMGRLNELLRTDSKARQVFAAHLNLDSALAEIAAGLPGEKAAVEDIVRLNRNAIFSNAVAYCVTAATLAFAVSLGVWWRSFAGQTPGQVARIAPTTDHVTVPQETVAAVLIDEAGAMFSQGMGPQGIRFEAGKYDLLSGIVQLRFASGAELVLTGPASWMVKDAMHAIVEHGKMRAIVPPAAKGFRISTPSAEYIDLGTEFGLEVDRKDGTSDLFVFDGQVNVADKSTNEVFEEVLEGGSTRYAQGVAKIAPDFDSKKFYTPNEIGLIRWQENARKLLQSQGLIAFFPFHRTANESELVNHVEAKENRAIHVPNGRIERARWTSGRWPGKDSLLFDGDDEFVQIDIPGASNALTIAAWVKIDRLDHEMNSILNSDHADDGDMHFQITRQGILRGGVQGAGTNDNFVGEPLTLGNWIHVAMVVSIPDHMRWVYANGQLARQGSLQRGTKVTPGSCRLGNWLPAVGHAKRNRALRGRIDELAIWDRALLESEIKEWAQAGRTSLR